MKISKIGAGLACAAMAFTFSGVAHADFINTVSSEAECLAQDGSVMDLNGTKHCLVAVIPPEFQSVEYAGELKGVTTCPEKSIRKTSIGDFCLIALEKKPAKSTLTQSLGQMAKDKAKNMAKDKMKDAAMDAVRGK